MTVSSETSRKTFAGNDVTTSFGTSPMVFFDSADLIVYVVTTATGAVVATLVENTDYTVTGGAGSTGTVSTAGGSDPYGAPATGTTLVIVRDVAATQESDFVNNDPSDAEVVEDALDRLTMGWQQLKTRLARALRFADSDVSGASVEIPAPEANNIFGWNAAGTALINYVIQAGSSLVDLTASSGASLIGFIQSGTGAVAETVQAALRRFKFAVQYGTLAQAATAASGGTLRIDTTINVASNTTVDATVGIKFEKGGIIKPASGVTVTVSGPLQAGMYQIFDLSAGGHVDLTGADIPSAHIEWWGVVGGDAAYDGTNAAANKPLIDEALTYGPRYLDWLAPGYYSTTGHRMDEPFHVMRGRGMEEAGSGVIGSGILHSDDAFMVTQGATLAGKKYVFFNGDGDGLPGFENMRVIASDLDTTIPYGILPSSSEVLNWQGYAEKSNFKGYVGKHIAWGNWNEWRNCFFQGKFACVAHTNWNDTSGAGNACYVQKQHYVSCIHSQTQNASGYVIYQDRVGDDSPTSTAISDNKWTACDFEYGYNGLNLTGKNQVFDTCHYENLSGATLLSGESTTYDSMHINPGVHTGAGSLSLSLSVLRANKGTRSSVTPDFGTEVLTLTGVPSAPTSTIRWSIIPGQIQMVLLEVPSVGGTSNSTAKTLGTLPTYLRPVREQFVTFMASDNGGAYVAAQGRLKTDGVIDLYATANVGSWTNSGAATIGSFFAVYALA